MNSNVARFGKALVVLLAVLCSLDATTFAQDEETHHRHPWKRFPFRGNPTISLNYGFTQSTLDGLSQSLASPRSAELKLGSMRIDRDESGILSMRHNYFALANISNEIGNKTSGGEINTDMWRFGFGWDKGYGYRLSETSDAAVFFHHANGVNWSKLTVRGNVAADADKELLSLYDAFRFGTKTEAGITVRVAPLVTINAGYERSAIFRRHLFWGWLGSVALEGGANWALDNFIEKVMKSSPEAVPVVNFILKNGLSYGVYQLRKEKMNYPFNSEPPILNDTFKIGVTFIL